MTLQVFISEIWHVVAKRDKRRKRQHRSASKELKNVRLGMNLLWQNLFWHSVQLRVLGLYALDLAGMKHDGLQVRSGKPQSLMRAIKFVEILLSA